MQTVDVIIPTYKPQQKFLQLLSMLQNQTVPVHRIIVMNTEEKYMESLVYGTDIKKKFSNIEVHHISQREFDHGNTRNRGAKKSDSPFFICMTQDAVPADEYLIENLLKPFQDEKVAVVYGRQLPEENCNPIERFTRQFNYPEQSVVKGMSDLSVLGIKTFFCSNACAAYRKSIFTEQGGFIRHTIFNEDMIYAAGAVMHDYLIAYAADAKVIHSHNYSGREEFHRNFDLGVSQADHPEIFEQVTSESEGIRLVKLTMKHLKEIGQQSEIPRLIWKSGCKFIGYKLGKNYRYLPRRIVRKCSMNRKYWYELAER